MSVLDLVSASTTGNAGNGSSVLTDGSAPGVSQDDRHVLSADGRFVAFTSTASNLVVGDANGASDVFVRDLLTGTTQLVSLGNLGTQGDGGSFNPSISADGRYVAFWSNADNLVSGDTNGAADVFVRDLVTNTTTLVSTDFHADPRNGGSFDPSISADGTKIVFWSYATNISATVATAGTANVYERDLTTQTTRLLSTDYTGLLGADSISYDPVISAEGTAVTFVSEASNISGPFTHTTGSNVYLIHISAVPGVPDVAPQLISINTAGSDGGNADSFNPTISADGRYVAFESEANNLTTIEVPPFPGANIFLRDTQPSSGRESDAVTTRVTNTTEGGTSDGDAIHTSISADGRYVVFASDADDLVAGDPGDGIQKIYLTDLLTNTTRVIATTGDQNANVTELAISGDGRTVVFTAAANNLGFTDSNNAPDVFAVRLVLDQAPVVTDPSGAVIAATSGEVFQLSSLFTASDPDNDPLGYYLYDASAGANTGHIEIAGVTQAEGQWIPVTQAQLSQTTFTASQTGASDTILMIADDGARQGYNYVHITTATNHAPVVTDPAGGVIAGTSGEVFQLSSLFTASDPDGDPLSYELYDASAGANTGHIKIAGVTQAEGQWISVTQAQLSQTTFTASQTGASDTILMIADDGALQGSNYVHITTATNHAPVVTDPSGSSIAATSGQVFQLSSLFSASDPDGDPLSYALYDATPGASTGHFAINGVVQAEGQWISVTQAQLSQTTFTSGQSGNADTILMIADDGALQGYNSVHVSVAANATGPAAQSASVVTVQSQTAPVLPIGNDPGGDGFGLFKSATPAAGSLILGGVQMNDPGMVHSGDAAPAPAGELTLTDHIDALAGFGALLAQSLVHAATHDFMLG